MGVTAINRRTRRKTSAGHKALLVAMVAAWAGVFAAAYALGRPKATPSHPPVTPSLATGTPAPATPISPAPSTVAPRGTAAARGTATARATAGGRAHPKISGLTPLPAPPPMQPRRPFVAESARPIVPVPVYRAPIVSAPPRTTSTPPPTTTGGGPHTSGGVGGGSTTVGSGGGGTSTTGGSSPTATHTTPSGGY